jgi:hypothetical protein
MTRRPTAAVPLFDYVAPRRRRLTGRQSAAVERTLRAHRGQGNPRVGDAQLAALLRDLAEAVDGEMAKPAEVRSLYAVSTAARCAADILDRLTGGTALPDATFDDFRALLSSTSRDTQAS